MSATLSAATVTCSQRRRLFFLACINMALFGVVHAFLGVVFGFPDMRARLHVDLASEGNMFLLLFLGVATIYLSGGLLVDRFGSKPVLAGVLAIYAAAMFAFSQATSVHLAMPATYFIGMGGGGLSICSSVLITEIYQEQRVAMMVAINAAMALGSLTFTFGAAALAGRLGVPFLALVVAAVIVLQGCFCLTQKFPSSLAAHGFSLANAVRVLAYPGVYLYALLLFVEATNEIAVVGWTPTWMGEIGASPRLATAALGMLQTALLVGRLVSFPFLKRIPMTMMVVCSLGAFLGAVIMFLSHTVPFMLVGVVILGFTYAAIYPSLLGFARDRYHQFAGTLMGAMMTSGVTGSMFGPWIVGHLPRAVPLHTRLIVPVVGTFLFIFLILALRRRTLRERAAAATVPEPETYGVS